MTEEDAKTKPCIGPAPSNTGVLGNPNGAGVLIYTCAGSTCLGWRWIGVRRKDPSGAGEYESISSESAGEAREGKYNNRNVAFLGHCGLAGKE